MTTPLRMHHHQSGAIFSQDEVLVPTSFGNDAAAYAAAKTGVALVDRSHWGRIRVGDRDRHRFLHNQSTNAIEGLQPGQGCETVLVTATARTLDLATVYVDSDTLLLLVSPGQASPLMDWMDRYIFFADKVTLANETETAITLSLMGPDSEALLAQLGVAVPPGAPLHSHFSATLAGTTVQIAIGNGLALPGFTLFAPVAAGAEVWQALQEAGAVPLGETVWERLRLEQGRPLPGAELTEDHNPLEAGLWHAVSFTKGCYIGQETIARLNTYQGVKQQLWGLQLAEGVPPGTPILLAEEKVGKVTSCVPVEEGAIALGYLRTKAGGAGLTVQVSDRPATVVDLPYATRGYLAAAQTA